MCGICGIYNLNNRHSINKKLVDDMLSVISHRGPDGRKSVVLDGMALGFNRLSFLDLKGGMQPISNETGDVVMVCNGEIYNYRELMEDLVRGGHCFRTKTDVEVIVHLYEEYGPAFPEKLNGQFAIALYDRRSKELFLVRDQIGICPLFYTCTDGRLLFASEIKAMLEYPEIPRRLNLSAVDQLMNYPGVVSPNTFFRDIYSLRAGHMLRIFPGGEIRDVEYWDMCYPEETEDLGEEYYVETLKALFRKAVSRRLVADVPVGFYISGGLDSSMVACYIGKYLLNSSYSFSAEIGEGELDESRYQHMVKDCVRSQHFRVRVTEKEIWEKLPEVIYYAESAVKESYDVAAYMLSALVRETPAKAVLTGQGSDEFFCGYVGYMVDLFRELQKGKMSPEECEVNERLWGDPYFRYERNHYEIRKIHEKMYSDHVRGEIESFSAFAQSPIDTGKVKNLSAQKRRSYIDYKLRLSDHLLGEHGDRMFFSHSVEGRHPFLDMEMLEFVRWMPDKYKLKGVNEKYIVKKAGKNIVPEEILRRKKFPFQAPGMSSMIKAVDSVVYLDDSVIQRQGVFDVKYIRHLKKVYAQKDFKLMGAYEIDYLLIAMTVTILCEQFHLNL